MADRIFDPLIFDPLIFQTGDATPPPPSVSTDDVQLIYHPDTDSLELVDQFSPKPRRGATYRGRRRGF